jgi:hypothetical protein
MSTELQNDQVLMKRARTAYEVGRLKLGATRAILLTLCVVALGTQLADTHVWLWAPPILLLWTALWWRGGPLLKSAHYGLAAGAITFLLPLSVLRPCCRPGMTGPVCTMPEMCVLAGALVGLPLAVLGLRHTRGRLLEAALGLGLGGMSVAAAKCGALFVGEAIGLLSGLALGIVAASTLRAVVPQRAL